MIWFNDTTPRRIKLRSAACLVGKAPTKQKRIKAIWTMYLDSGGESQIAGLPEWLETARDYVMAHGETITASHVIREVNLTMGDQNLFRKTPTEAPKTQIDHFQVKRIGEADEPDTVVTFETRTQFSADLWGWLGQQAGEEFDVQFTTINMGGVATQDDTLNLVPAGDDEASDEEDDASEGEEDFEAQRKEACDPKHDSEFEVAAAKIDEHLNKEKRSKAIKDPTPRQVADAKQKLTLM